MTHVPIETRLAQMHELMLALQSKLLEAEQRERQKSNEIMQIQTQMTTLTQEVLSMKALIGKIVELAADKSLISCPQCEEVKGVDAFEDGDYLCKECWEKR